MHGKLNFYWNCNKFDRLNELSALSCQILFLMGRVFPKQRWYAIENGNIYYNPNKKWWVVIISNIVIND